MLDFFRRVRPWAQLDRLLERLPRHSLYKAALDDDEEFAALAVKAHRDDPEVAVAVPLAGYDDVVLRLDNIFDAVMALNETLIAVNSRKSAMRKPLRAPRPETAYQRLAKQTKVDQLESIVDKMTGGR